jgi:2-phosphoglycerate kinase
MNHQRRPDPFPFAGEDGLPYSKGLMARALIATGVARMRAYELALRVETDLRARGASNVELERLHELAVEVLGEEEGSQAMARLRRYRALQAIDLPILVLVGGGTGTGKSTVATEVAQRLGITRVTSTDFVRQTMRAFFSPEFLPSVHFSSFEVGEALPAAEREAVDPLVVGFIDQTRNVLVGVQASIDRALEEGWSMVLEGVHLVPGMLTEPTGPALFVHVVLAIDDEEIHAQHFWLRDSGSTGMRPLDRYLERLADIRQIQDFIGEEARKVAVPVIQNRNIEQTIGAVIELVVERAARLQTAS